MRRLSPALKIAPTDEAIGQRLRSCERVLTLDPTFPGLRTAERYRRSRSLLELAVAALDQCAASHSEVPLPESGAQVAGRARKELTSRRKPESYGDAADENIAMVRELWESRPKPCQFPESSGDAVSRVMAHLLR